MAAPWGNSSTVTSFSSRNRRSHLLEADGAPSVTEPGQQQEPISQTDFSSRCDLRRDERSNESHSHLVLTS
ncbi:Hypothetical protein SMAX5B_019056 [Scophthalmus maximus]|uniref:Uncharacterized protein n=1 Tax=Scophthalmus maximus TaxID=52904 RepID=A0A2U9CC16_SCOMX|nr:Hypothetical protein SMAX5B_019056 [Scophthalmus maximus]KAF0039622.1 hypothetical protein F2P81_007857 [Scophthalmus maximus]